MEKTIQNKTEKEVTPGSTSDNDKVAPKQRPVSKRRSRRRLPAW